MNDNANQIANQLVSDAAGEAAVWHLSGEAGPASTAAAVDAALLASARGVDAALRALAASESPDAIEMRRMRDAAIRTTRLHAVEAMGRRTLSPVAGPRRLPKWAFASAAAAAIVVGLVVWLVNTNPSSSAPAIAKNFDDDGRAERETYAPLLTAFAAVDPVDGTASAALDDLDSEVVDLSLLGGGTVDN